MATVTFSHKVETSRTCASFQDQCGHPEQVVETIVDAITSAEPDAVYAWHLSFNFRSQKLQSSMIFHNLPEVEDGVRQDDTCVRAN